MSPIPPLRKSLPLTGVLLAAATLVIGCGTAGGGIGSSTGSQSATAPAVVAADVNSAECGKPTRTIKHDLGSTTITGTPHRIAVLELSFVDAIENLGLQPVGVADDNNRDVLIPALRDKVGNYTPLGLRASPNLQVITSLKPDLIIADSAEHSAIYTQLSKIAPTIAVSSDAAGYQETINSEKLIAEAAGKCDRMKAVLDHHAQVMQGLKAKIPPGDTRKILFAIGTETGVTGYTPRGFAPGVLAALGLHSPLPDKGDDFHVSVNLETLVTMKPDVIIMAPHPGKLLLDQWKTTQLWGTLPAVQKNAVFMVNQNLWSRARGLVAAEQIATEAVQKLAGPA
ncbi:Fe(3+) dicitrate ABC transporter substrate-binding protein [Amycolatopsis sp. DSM 110486]|uniref:ABC transporter substrate-binding protein n=1 Tax=Amycolatopsis sp. DSM 110486 TaxID=2865832 RepID=UPI001C6A20DC|nr:Fe(3+) dicitrate ABC transporter substrate-binding protein [Amycolatopsis sp. DSM 110486]QYN18991.1 ABC transporter substrate-binding protein [Amycolatopsis sp. DSM 110486]